MIAGNIVLVDFDVVVYSSAFAAQKTSYVYQGVEYEGKRKLKEAHPNPVEEDVETIVRAEPLGHARQCARQLVQSILDACAPVQDAKGWLTGKGNFRERVATIQPYKGNRTQAPPVWKDEIREYLASECGAEFVDGIEADDKLVVEFLKDPERSIVATIDKDLAQVEGIRLYNWQKKELKTISPLEAKRNFYKQLLKGDPTDHIKGVEGIGDAKAEKIIGKLKDEKLMLVAAYTEYLRVYGKNAWAYLMETAKLIYMLRSDSDIQNPTEAFKPCIVPEGAV